MIKYLTVKNKQFLINNNDLFELTSIEDVMNILKPALVAENNDMLVYHVYQSGEEIIPADEDFPEEINKVNNPMFLVYNKYNILHMWSIAYNRTRSGEPAKDEENYNYDNDKCYVYNKVIIVTINDFTHNFIYVYDNKTNKIIMEDNYIDFNLLGEDKIKSIFNNVNNITDFESALDNIDNIQWIENNEK